MAVEPRKTTRWRELVGPASLICCPALLFVYLAIRHGLEPSVGIRAIAALYFLHLIPGYLVQRLVFRMNGVSPFETLLSAALVGMLLTPMAWYALCWAGLSGAFAPVVLVTGLAVPLRLGWHRHTLTKLKRLVAPADAPILWLALSLAVLWSYGLGVVEVREGRAYTIPHRDTLAHASLVAELARGVPPQAFPFVAGVRRLEYHHMPDVWCDLMRRATGADLHDAVFYLTPPWLCAFTALGGYLILVRRFGRVAALIGVFGMLAVVEPARYFYPQGPLIFMHRNMTGSFGLVGAALVIFYISTMIRQRPRGPILSAALISVLLLWYKANFALVVAPAVAIFATVILLKRRDYRWLILCLTVQAVVTGFRHFQLSGADMKHTLVMAPLAYLRWEWMGMVLPAALEVSLRQAIERLPALLEWPLIFVIWLVYRFHVGIVILAYLVFRGGFGRSGHEDGNVDRLILIILGSCALGFLFLPVQDTLVWNICASMRILPHALLSALMGPVVCHLVRRHSLTCGWHGQAQRRHVVTDPCRRPPPAGLGMPPSTGTLRVDAALGRRLTLRRKALAVGTWAVLILLFVANAVVLGRKALTETRWQTDIGSVELLSCYRFIESSTPLDAVILQPRRFPETCEVSALTKRRMVLEFGQPWDAFINLDQIVADVARFYNGASPEVARAILERYEVDYVIADLSESKISADDALLTPVFRNGDAVVYRVARGLDVEAKLARGMSGNG